MDEISIAPEVIEEEIAALKGLLGGNAPKAYSVQSLGKSAECGQAFIQYFDSLNASLDQLISNTIAFLEQAKAGYIKADQSSARILQQFKEAIR